MNLNEYRDAAHDNALRKGFHNTYFDALAHSQAMADAVLAGKFALIHSEVDEAAEAYVLNDPEGYYEELADVDIRIFDLCGLLNIDLDDAVRYATERDAVQVIDDWLLDIHGCISRAMEHHRKGREAKMGESLGEAVQAVSSLGPDEARGGILVEIDKKMAFNKGREKLHGGKY